MIQYSREKPPCVSKKLARLGLLTESFFFCVMNTVMIIPAPFWFDGASIPFVFWWIARPFTSWVVEASLVHDVLYRCHMLPGFRVWNEQANTFRPMTRWEIDRVFLVVMRMNIKLAGGSRTKQCSRLIRARRIYNAVRVFGWAFWGDGWGKMHWRTAERIKELGYA
jgi:hypothetical protein